MALKRDRIKGNELFLCVRETGTSFDFLPPPVAVKALKKLADVLFLDSASRHRRRPLFVLGGQLHRLQFSSRVIIQITSASAETKMSNVGPANRIAPESSLLQAESGGTKCKHASQRVACLNAGV